MSSYSLSPLSAKLAMKMFLKRFWSFILLPCNFSQSSDSDIGFLILSGYLNWDIMLLVFQSSSSEPSLVGSYDNSITIFFLFLVGLVSDKLMTNYSLFRSSRWQAILCWAPWCCSYLYCSGTFALILFSCWSSVFHLTDCYQNRVKNWRRWLGHLLILNAVQKHNR